MTVEEVSELLGEETATGEKSFKAVAARVKAGRTISKATAERISAACKMIGDGHGALVKMLSDDESPQEDSGESGEEKSAPDTGKAALALTQRARDLAVLKFRAAP